MLAVREQRDGAGVHPRPGPRGGLVPGEEAGGPVGGAGVPAG